MQKEISDIINQSSSSPSLEYYEEETENQRQNAIGKLADEIVDATYGAAVDYVNDLKASGERARTASLEAVKNLPVEYFNDFNINPDVELTDPQQKIANNFEKAKVDVADKAFRDPALLAGTLLTWGGDQLVFTGAALPFIALDLAEANENDELGSQVVSIAGSHVAAVSMEKFSIFARFLLPSLAKKCSGLGKWTPISALVDLGAGAYTGALQESWAEHPLRTIYNYTGNDIVEMAGHTYRAGKARVKANAEKTKASPPSDSIPTPPSPTQKDAPQTQNNAGVMPNKSDMIKPMEKSQKPKTLNEKAFPETLEEVSAQNDYIAKSVSDDILEARQLPDIMQGARGDTLTYGSDNLYPSPVSIDQIWKTAQRMFPALPTRVQADKNTLGYFRSETEGIRVRGFKSWSVLCHETGHGISKEINWGTDPSIQSELKSGALSIWKHGEYGDPVANHTVWIEEGRAAFMNEYLINPEMAQKHFPLAFKDFEEKIMSHPELQAQLEILGQQVRRWGNDSVYQQMNSTIAYADKDYKPISTKISDALLKVETATIDELAPLRKVCEDFVNNQNKKIDEVSKYLKDKDGNPAPRQRVHMSFEENPANVAQRAKEGINATTNALLGDSGIDTHTIIQALSNKYDTPLHPVTFKDVMSPLRQLSEKGDAWLLEHGYTKKQGYYEAFSSYALAKHELEVIDVQNKKRIKAIDEQLETAKLAKTELTQKMSQTTKETPEGMALSESMKKQIEKLDKKMNKLVMKRMEIALGRDDYMTATPRADLERVVSEGDKVKEFREALTLYGQYNENILLLAARAGIIKNSDVVNFVTNYPNYVPMQRSFVVEGKTGMSGVGADSAYANITNALHSLSKEGSDRTIKDPMVQTMLNTQTMVSKIERNKVAQAVVALSKQEGGDRLLMPVKGTGSKSSEQIITVYENGEKKAYQCMTPMLYDALTVADKSTQIVQLNAIESILQGTAQTLRRGATATWAFAARNMVKDLLNATCLNKDGRKTHLPFVDQALLLWDGVMAKMDKKLQAEIKAEGLQYTSYIGSGKKINFDMRDYVEANPHHVQTVWDKITGVVDVGEQLPRLGLYKRARARGCTPFEAASIASDGTTNFMRSGSQVKQINRYIPFFNAVIQGNNKVFRAIKDDPVGVGLTCMSYVTIPSLICWYKNHDKDWYRDMPLDKKNKNWYWDMSPQQDGSAVIAIPKNEMVGYVFGSVPERILDYAIDNDKDGEVLNKTLKETIGQMIPSGFPTALLPIIEWQANYSFFRDRPIVDARMASKVKDEDQYTPYTSEVAKRMGKATGLSPMKIDNTIYDLTATMGYTATGFIDMFAKDTQRANRKWTEYTSLTYTPNTASSRTSDVFYDNLNRLEKEHGSNVLSKGKNAKLKAPKALAGMRKAKRDADKISLKIKALDGTKYEDNDLKRKDRDALVKQRNQIMRRANKKYLGYKYIQSPE